MIHALFMDGGSRRRARSLMCTGGRARIPARALLALAALPACVGLGPDDAASSSPGVAAPAALRKAPGDAQALADQYRSFLDRGRTPALYIRLAAASAPGFRRVDPLTDAPARLSPGDRLLFVDRDRSAIFAVIGRRPLADAGARLIGAHIDTPAPRLDTTQLTRDGQVTLTAYSYGGIKRHHWLYRPLAAVGQVAARGGRLIDVALGLPPDEFALFATKVSQDGKTLEVMTSSTPTEDGPAGPAQTLVSELHRRHGIAAPDLVAAELFLVPREPAREVGLDRALIGGHGQDDRSNSFVAWRAAADLPSPPDRTALVWLVDREEQGSPGPTGAGSHLLELVYAWLLRAEGAPASEASLARALAATVALSADTPACLNPNWPEVHEPSAAPRAGGGPALFPYTGSRGKRGGSAARAELVASVMASFRRAGVPVQTGTLGRVDEGGGGTIARDLAHRGMDVVDVGVCVISMHSPFELVAKADLWAAYRGFRAWLTE